MSHKQWLKTVFSINVERILALSWLLFFSTESFGVIDSDLLLQATNGDKAAQYQLGKRYFHGDGVKKDLVKAYALLSISSHLIGEDALKLLHETTLQLDSKQIEEASEIAERILNSAYVLYEHAYFSQPDFFKSSKRMPVIKHEIEGISRYIVDISSLYYRENIFDRLYFLNGMLWLNFKEYLLGLDTYLETAELYTLEKAPDSLEVFDEHLLFISNEKEGALLTSVKPSLKGRHKVRLDQKFAYFANDDRQNKSEIFISSHGERLIRVTPSNLDNPSKTEFNITHLTLNAWGRDVSRTRDGTFLVHWDRGDVCLSKVTVTGEAVSYRKSDLGLPSHVFCHHISRNGNNLWLGLVDKENKKSSFLNLNVLRDKWKLIERSKNNLALNSSPIGQYENWLFYFSCGNTFILDTTTLNARELDINSIFPNNNIPKNVRGILPDEYFSKHNYCISDQRVYGENLWLYKVIGKRLLLIYRIPIQKLLS